MLATDYTPTRSITWNAMATMFRIIHQIMDYISCEPHIRTSLEMTCGIINGDCISGEIQNTIISLAITSHPILMECI